MPKEKSESAERSEDQFALRREKLTSASYSDSDGDGSADLLLALAKLPSKSKPKSASSGSTPTKHKIRADENDGPAPKRGRRYAPSQNAPTVLSREVFAGDMGQPIKLAATKDAPTKSRKVESVGVMGRRMGQL
eukprot:CAMPEP_0201877436 /NCGR_PEP_ID=MMETSP0902-20130614/8845_1 /ASSEMBLY_ACC=CAM_ASM_000551 /TAXON_ID=420261 /ORGANISM="Thalassiosira antarctica, Strain CCMP982" /LENGTH=133 /DNA_ID=CAMNT_0048404875 /DNA_START=19 /DNA_END=421 /DNA_ORIENTATION=+